MNGPRLIFCRKLMTFNARDGEASQWLTTPEAARKLQISETTLRRWRDHENGLILGKHYKRGFFKNTPIRWNVPEIQLFLQANAYSAPPKGGAA